MRLNKTFREFRDFADDHHMTMPLSVAAGALKGAIVGLAIGKLALATAAGILKSLVGFVLIVASYALAQRFANYRIF